MDSSLPDAWCPGRQLIGTLNAHNLLQLEFKVRRLAHGHIGIRGANPLLLGDSYWLLL
jgi:hypothetical protein